MFKEKLSLVPKKPGCYLMKNKDNNIIYVGKAKDLSKRLKSYFNKLQTGKTLALVSNIKDFEYIITSSEIESLILEINLIKKYNPKYNILLKDDKTYPYIELTCEKYPRLKIVRIKKRKKTKNKLFGPYPNVTSARETVDLLNRIYPLRKCNNLKKEPCLYYHIGECLGYCKYNVSQAKIDTMIKEIISILEGDYKLITKKLEDEMKRASEDFNYEKALLLRNAIENIKQTINKQIIVSNIKYNFDVFGYYIQDNFLAIDTLLIRKGIVVGRKSNILNINDYDNDIFIRYIIDFYEKYELPNEIVVPDEIHYDLLNEYLNIKVTVPQKGNIKHILNMANVNAETILKEKIELIKKDDKTKEEVAKQLKEILDLEKLDRIELFDNSHLFGTYYVGGMVVYENMEPSKKEYRKYKIDVNVKDDLRAMKEVIYRRYYRVLLDKLIFPDLIIVDGGQLQVNAAKEILDSLNINIKIIGLKKNDKHQTNSIIDSNLQEIIFPKDNKLLLYLTKMQDEVHRFVINYHRDIKSKGSISSVFDNIEGIGEKRKQLLLKKYGSLKKLREVSDEELEKILPKKVVKGLREYLNNT